MNYEQWLDKLLEHINHSYIVASERGEVPSDAQIRCFREFMLLDFELNVLPALRGLEPYNGKENLSVANILLSGE